MSAHAPQSAPTAARVLLEASGHLAPEPRVHYVSHPFHVPAGARRVLLTFAFQRETLAQLAVSLHDPHGFRGHRTRHYVRGRVEVELWVAPDGAGEGCLPGPLPEGEWRAQVDVERLGEETDYTLQVQAEFGPAAPPAEVPYPEGVVARPHAGWYRGELHAHSTESDGKYPVETVVEAARAAGLDFLSLTEHITVSHWPKLARLVGGPMALLRACEITSHQGHANLHGIRRWVDVYVDRPGWSMDQAADAVHAQGGLFCVNHPFSGDFGWRAYDFDWSKADLLEVYHSLEGPNNNLQAPLWDSHLRLGRRIVGVAGTDSHDPFTGLHRLGQWMTWVYAPELSERGIVEGLRRGQVYASCGPRLQFQAISGTGQEAAMWESLPLRGGPVTFRVDVRSEQPLRLFILKDGYPFATRLVDGRPEGQWQALTFADEPSRPAYYRLELHRPYASDVYPGIEWRDFTTLQAFSNPIWLGRPQ